MSLTCVQSTWAKSATSASTSTDMVRTVGYLVQFEPCVYPKCHYLQVIRFHVSFQCVSVQRTRNLFRLRSIVTAHMNVLPNKSGPSPKVLDYIPVISKLHNLTGPKKLSLLRFCEKRRSMVMEILSTLASPQGFITSRFAIVGSQPNAKDLTLGFDTGKSQSRTPPLQAMFFGA